MNSKLTLKTFFHGVGVSLLLGSVLLTMGCAPSADDRANPVTGQSLLGMDIPDSLTGGAGTGTPSGVLVRAASGLKSAGGDSSGPCFYNGVEDEDILRNGYRMTKFMVSAMTTWTCVTDLIIDIASTVPNDGIIYASDDNDTTDPNYEADEPTHYSVTANSDTQKTVRMYYGYDRVSPPSEQDAPGFFISWNEIDEENITGRLVANAADMDPVDHAVDDPTNLRIDFTYSDTAKVADMFLRFDNGNQWAEGFRIEVSKDLTANPLEDVFTARGLIELKAQFVPVSGITEIPQMRMYTVADRLGEGAAVAEFIDVALPLEIDATTGDHLGNYVFNKTDIYFFDADQTSVEPWDFIQKNITDSEYRGSRNLVTMTTADIINYFNPDLSLSYFSGSECANVGDDCTELLNLIFKDGFVDQEQNQGSDPMDWRSTAITNPAYLTTVYPNGTDWTGAFDPSYTP